MRTLVPLLGLVLLAVAPSARAQDAGPPTAVEAVHFTYAADETCPSKEEFTALLTARGASFAESDAAARALDVSLHRASPGAPTWTGTMRVVDGSSTATRSIGASTCAELARSLAILSSLALNPPPTMRAAPTASTPTSAAAEPHPAPPPRRPPPPPHPTAVPDAPIAPLVHRRRWLLEAEGAFLRPFGSGTEQWGFGLAARRFVSERFGLGVDVDLFFAPPGPSSALIETKGTTNDAVRIFPAPKTMIGARSMLEGEFVLGRARGTLDDGLHLRHLPIDLTLGAGAGALWTRPIPEGSGFGWAPRPAVDVGFGERLFVTETVALALGERFVAYLDRDESDLDRAVFRTALGASLGLEALLPDGRSGAETRGDRSE